MTSEGTLQRGPREKVVSLSQKVSKGCSAAVRKSEQQVASVSQNCGRVCTELGHDSCTLLSAASHRCTFIICFTIFFLMGK